MPVGTVAFRAGGSGWQNKHKHKYKHKSLSRGSAEIWVFGKDAERMDQDRQGVKLIGVVKVGVADHLRLQCYSSCLFLPPPPGNIGCRTEQREHISGARRSSGASSGYDLRTTRLYQT
jgi:hypothetical protein